MRRMVFVVVLGMLAACAAEPVDDEVESQSSAVIDGDKLPGGCNNPLICHVGDPPQDDPTGGGGQRPQCTGCICIHTAQECSACNTRCQVSYIECLGSFPGPSAEGCDALRQQCRRDCGGQGISCDCPR